MGGIYNHSYSSSLTHSLFLFSLLMTAAPSLHYPLPAAKGGPSRSVQPLLAFTATKTVSGSARHEREEPWEERMDVSDIEDKVALSADALDTMRKINPLTIANQVSQMFQNKGDDKRSYRQSHNKQCRGQGDEEVGGPGAHASFAHQPEVDRDRSRDVGARVPGYIKEDLPTIVHKPRTNDFGYSVMVMAGSPLEVKGKGMQVMRPYNRMDDGPQRKVFGGRELPEDVKDKEWRVPKPVDAQPVFPVYDEDISFLPDPFNGILDENYSMDQAAAEKSQAAAPQQEGVQTGQLWHDSHEVRARSVDEAKDNNAAQFGDLYSKMSGKMDSVVTLNTPAIKM